jgi:hypothetical protein
MPAPAFTPEVTRSPVIKRLWLAWNPPAFTPALMLNPAFLIAFIVVLLLRRRGGDDWRFCTCRACGETA